MLDKGVSRNIVTLQPCVYFNLLYFLFNTSLFWFTESIHIYIYIKLPIYLYTR